MKWREGGSREYYKKYERLDVKNGKGWFEVYRLPEEVYGICEPQHIQEVNSFLILGEEKALLLDTGMGVCDIEPLVRELYPGEIVAVNSHCHLDHIGGNHSFEPVYIYEEERVKRIARTGAGKEAMGNQLEEDMFLQDYPENFYPDDFFIPPFKVRFMKEGDCFDLGGRSLRVIHTPGHSEDSVMLWDEGRGILFTGDSFYLGPLYAHFDSEEKGYSDLEAYQRSLRKVEKATRGLKALYCSHNDFLAGPEKLTEAAEAMESILRREAEKKREEDKDGGREKSGGLCRRKKTEELFFHEFSVVYQALA